MHKKDLLVRNDRASSISLDTIHGLETIDPGETAAVSVTPSQYALISALSDLTITDVTSTDLLTTLQGIKDTDGIKKIADTVTVQVLSTKVTAVTFHEDATEPGDGEEFMVGAYKNLTVEIYGDSTNREILFICRGPSGVDRPLKGNNISSFVADTKTTGTGEIWQFDVTGFTSVLMKLESVAGGSVTVKGNAIV